MGVDFYMKGALEPIVTKEGFQATVANLNVAIANNKYWFMVEDAEGEDCLIHIPHLLYVRHNQQTEA